MKSCNIFYLHQYLFRSFQGKPLFSLFLLVLTASFFSDIAIAGESLGKTHKDTIFGFSIRVPKDWNYTISQEGERYIVAKYDKKRAVEIKKDKDYMGYTHRPSLRILAFTSENTKVQDNIKKENDVTYVSPQNPFRNFKEYTKQFARGFYFGEEKEAKVNGIPCTYLDVIMEQATVPTRWVACIYHLEDVDIAVYYEILEEYHSDYKNMLSGSMKSLKKIKREKKADSPAIYAKPQTREEFIKSKTDKLSDGWWHMASKEHLLISHASRKYTAKIASFADAIRKVIDKDTKKLLSLKKGSKKKSVALPIIRVCASQAEYSSYNDSSGGVQSFNAETREVVVYDGTREGYNIDWVYSRISSGIYAQYAGEIFSGSYSLQPDYWYILGMSYYYSNFKGKGASLKFKPDERDKEMLRRSLREGGCSSLKSILNPNSKSTMLSSYGNYLKAGAFVCFLKSRDGNRKPWKGTLSRYMNNYNTYASKAKKDLDKTISETAKKVATDDEEEEDEDDEEREKAIKELNERRKDMRAMIFNETFLNWTDTEWKRMEKAWEKWAL